jgi:hypothetical protein
MSTRPNSYRPRCYRLDDWSSVPLRAGGALGPCWTAVLNTTGKDVEQGTVMDLSDPKTWTDGLSVVLGAPHIVAPLVGGGRLGCLVVPWNGRQIKNRRPTGAVGQC